MRTQSLQALGHAHGMGVLQPMARTAIELIVELAMRAARGIESWRAAARERRDIAAFNTMPDHLLRDIGISRSQLMHMDQKEWRNSR